MCTSFLHSLLSRLNKDLLNDQCHRPESDVIRWSPAGVQERVMQPELILAMRDATDSGHVSAFPTQNREDEVHQSVQCTNDATLYTGQVRYVNCLTTLFD